VQGDTGELLERARGTLLRRAGAACPIAHFAGMRLCVAQEIVPFGRGDAVGEREPVIIFGYERDRGDVAELELRVPVERRVDRLEMRAQQQSIAVARLR